VSNVPRIKAKQAPAWESLSTSSRFEYGENLVSKNYEQQTFDLTSGSYKKLFCFQEAITNALDIRLPDSD
jgi:hypothetical protein